MADEREMEKLLCDISVELTGPRAPIELAYQYRDVLKNRLLPLLEAGQAMRKINSVNRKTKAHEAWDAALAAAQKGS